MSHLLKREKFDPTTLLFGQVPRLPFVCVQTPKSRTLRVHPLNEEGAISVLVFSAAGAYDLANYTCEPASCLSF